MDPRPRFCRALTSAEIEAAVEVRRAVFVREQGSPLEEEPDALDAEARHYLVWCGGEAVGAARLLALGPGLGRIGRVCLLPAARRRGWGKGLLEFVVSDAVALDLRELVLDAQVQTMPFYERFGFTPEGDLFDDAGIPHRRMRRRLRDE
jgi:predicted GNAT family N-acyltransferase